RTNSRPPRLSSEKRSETSDKGATMGKQHRLALGTLLAALAVASLGYSQYPPPPKEETLNQRPARLSNLPEPDVKRFLSVLGPAVREELGKGKEVSLSGLGTFRIVRVAEHRDLRNGRPVMIPAVNTVEFLPEGGTLEAANGENVQP